MPSLRPTTSVVGSGVSSLIRSASSVRNTVQAIQDKSAADVWATSGYTDTAYKTYSNYLNSRISNLQALGAPSDILKAMTLADTLRTASRQNTSARIAQMGIQVTIGNMTDQQKLTEIGKLYTKAINNQDLTLATTLETKFYSLSQKIQYDQQKAAEASATLAKTNASADARVAAGNAEAALKGLKQLNSDLATVGEKGATKFISNWLNTKSADFGGKSPLEALSSLGIHLPKGAQPNPIDIAQGVGAYAYNQYAIASKAVDPYLQPGQNNSYEDKANAIVDGSTKIPVIGGQSVEYGKLGAYSTAIAQSYVGYNNTTGGYGKLTAADLAKAVAAPGTTFNGWHWGPHGITPTLSSNGFVTTSPQLVVEANALGLNTSAKNGKGGLEQGSAAQVTDGSPQWLKNIAKVGSWLNVSLNQNNQLTFTGMSTQGDGNALYTVIKDSSGKRALSETNSYSDMIIGGQYGFNPGTVNLANEVDGAHKGQWAPHLSLSSDFHGVNQVIQQAQDRAQAIVRVSATTLAAAKAMVSGPPEKLPNIIVPRVSAPASVAQPSRASNLKPLDAQPNITGVGPQTTPRVQGGGDAQGGTGFNFQGGGGFNLQ